MVCYLVSSFPSRYSHHTGSYPPPKDGYGKYANYGKYGAAKRDAEPEANPDGYGKYADYGMLNTALPHWI